MKQAQTEPPQPLLICFLIGAGSHVVGGTAYILLTFSHRFFTRTPQRRKHFRRIHQSVLARQGKICQHPAMSRQQWPLSCSENLDEPRDSGVTLYTWGCIWDTLREALLLFCHPCTVRQRREDHTHRGNADSEEGLFKRLIHFSVLAHCCSQLHE